MQGESLYAGRVFGRCDVAVMRRVTLAHYVLTVDGNCHRMTGTVLGVEHGAPEELTFFSEANFNQVRWCSTHGSRRRNKQIKQKAAFHITCIVFADQIRSASDLHGSTST